jgi:glycosyltransferase involved in cell wall biosynthesis
VKKNILIISTAGLGLGGITVFMLNTIERLPNFNFDIVVSGYYEDKTIQIFRELGCNIIMCPPRKKEPFKYFMHLLKCVSKRHYDTIHIHGNSASMLFECVIAKYGRIPCRIVHSHNTTCEHKTMHRFLNFFFKKGSAYTVALACSQLSGDWLFGKDNFEVIPNAIDVKKYAFNASVRKEVRTEWGINEDILVVGHVGNFNEQKNHDFLIDVFYEIQNTRKAVLLLIGIGELYDSIQKKVAQLGIIESVRFMGRQTNMPQIYQGIDIIVFPSRWEGFPFVMIEAQAASIPCLVSNRISDEVKIADAYKAIPLEKTAYEWFKEIELLLFQSKRTDPICQKMTTYSITNTIERLQFYYMH